MMKKNTTTDSNYSSVITHSLQNLWPTLFLLAIFCLAVMVRLDALPQWLEQPDRAFYSGEPLLPSVDGYYYLSLSQDLLDGKYVTINEMRGVPDYPLRPSPPPLLSWLGYMIARFSGLSLNWVAMLMPAMLGSLIVFPVYAYGKKFNGRFMGVTSALFAALSIIYVLRTRIGAYDTDCLIISLCLSIGLFFWNFATAEKGMARVSYFIAALFTTLLLYLWWEQTPDVVFAISAAFCCIALLFFYRPPLREGFVFYGLLCGALLLVPFFQGTGFYAEFFGKVSSMFTYISKEGNSLYPNIGGSIVEQQAYPLEKVIKQTTVTVHIFVLSLSGLLGLLIKRKKDCIVLLVPLVIGILGVFYASRFLIFLTPVLALGLGFFLSEFWNSSKKLYRFLALSFFLLLAVSYHFHATSNLVTWPFINRNDVHALVQVRKSTPDNAVIWSTWGKGYLINYWARRATISDGAIHSGQLSHFLYWPLAQEDPRFATNFIKFFAVRGREGIAEFRRLTELSENDALAKIREILAADSANVIALCKQLPMDVNGGKQIMPLDWIAFFFPTADRPVYLFLHQRMVFSSYWWYWYGTWNIAKHDGTHAKYTLYEHIMLGETSLTTLWGRHVDFLSGEITRGEQTRQLSEIYEQDGGHITKRLFSEGEGILYVRRQPEVAVLMDDVLWDSVFNRLFIRSNHDDGHFTPFFLDKFNAQVWKVE